jgi:tetratricopeptide (TPR) repeat protein
MRLLAVLLIISLSPLAAHAEDDRASARDHFLKGKKAFELGAFDEAVTEYMAAYRLKDDPALLYNLGQAHRLAGHATEAQHFYKMYLTRTPDAANRAEVETKLAELAKLVEQEKRTEGLEPNHVRPLNGETDAATRAQVAPPSPPPRVPSWSERHPGGVKTIAGIATAGVGVALLATGIAFGVMAKQEADDLTRIGREMGTFDPAKQSAGKTDQTIEAVTLGVGGAALATGALLVVLGRREARRASAERATTVLPWIGPRVAGAAVSVRF